ncbi:MAG TPA: CvpA family protein, partial [Chitinophagaceae bacterium]|nr:CvpA family protein [Chitinophagaceae bacterium]
MNWVDIVIVLVFLLAVWAGWHRGFILGSLDLLAWAGSLLLGYVFYPYLARAMDNFLDIGPWLQPLAFIFTTLIARILI